MFDPGELKDLQKKIQEATERDLWLLDDLRAEAGELGDDVRAIEPRSMTSVSLVASDGGNNKMVFDPFHVQLVRVVDSYGKRFCLDAVTPTMDTDELGEAQFKPDGSPRTALGRMMADLRVGSRRLSALSHMIPQGAKTRERPDDVSPSWVLVYRDLCEWAALYEQISDSTFAAHTLLVRDGLLRSKLFRGELFITYRRLVENAIRHHLQAHNRRIFLVGVAKRSKVLERYRLAMELNGTFAADGPRYVRVPRPLEAKAYVWPEYARGSETERTGGEAPKFVAGDMYLVRFGSRSGDPIWPVDIFSSQTDRADEVLGYLLADSLSGFPIPLYPRCLQMAHEHAAVVGLDLDVLQDEVSNAVRGLLPADEWSAFDRHRLQEDVTKLRYS